LVPTIAVYVIRRQAQQVRAGLAWPVASCRRS
jgi:hypothetical protein